ncbi:MAG: cadherin repeat domain-containing protein [Bacteroidota bacterium]
MSHWNSIIKYLLVAPVFFLLSCGEDEEVASLLEAEGFSTTIDENPSAGQELGTVNATTNLTSITFRLVSQSIAGAMEVDASSGAVIVQQESDFDFETNPTLTAIVSASDGVKTIEVDIEVTLNDVEGVITSSDFSVSVDENPDQGQVLGTLDATTDAGSLSFSVNQSQPADALFVNATTGELVVQDRLKFDFDTNPTISGVIDATNGEVTSQISVAIQLNDIDETIGFDVWSGPTLTFSKASGADPTLEANQDRISSNVFITRDNDGGAIYNAFNEATEDKATSPSGTEWAKGITANLSQLTFSTFRDALDNSPKSSPGQDLVLHLIEDDVYLDIKFDSWAQGRTDGGGFSYTRSTP